MTNAMEHWTGHAGDRYRQRQPEEALLNSYTAMWMKIFRYLPWTPMSVLEIGANTGLNLDAIRRIDPRVRTAGYEPNEESRRSMLRKGHAEWNANVSGIQHLEEFDLTFTRGVLIHIPPRHLLDAYERLHRASTRYIVVAEYYNPTPIEIEYRGQMGLLWKRDFAGEMLDRFRDLRLVAYGFEYHRDPIAPQDDVTWFLLEKMKGENNA